MPKASIAKSIKTSGDTKETLDQANEILNQLASVFFPDAEISHHVELGGDVDAETKYQTLVEQIPAVVFMAFLDKGLSEAYVSPHIEAILGFTQKEWLDDPVRWYWQIYPDDRNRWNVEAANMLLTGKPLRSVYRVLSRDNRIVWFQVEAKMVRAGSGRPWFIHGVAFDVTELKHTEQQLQKTLDELEMRVDQRTEELAQANRDLELEITVRKQIELERIELLHREQKARAEAEASNRAKDQFLATVSHELRTPLNVILGWTHMLQSKDLDATMVQRALEVVDQSAKAQSMLIEDLLDVSSMIAGKLRLDLHPVDLDSVVDAAVHSMKPAAEAKDVKLIKILDSTAGPVLGDAGRLRQVVLNLLSNSIKFTPAGGKITVRLERPDSSALISITDTGEGISPDFLPNVFSRFSQADSTFTRKHGGLGLGLAIVQHLVEMHGGEVRAESDGLNCGSTFSIKLPLLGVKAKTPLLSAHQEKTQFEPGRIPALEGLRILVVDDEPDTLEMIHVVLTQCGAEVTSAISAEEGFRALQNWKPDLLVSDIGMPNEDGFTFIARVRELPSEKGGLIPALALSAHARPEDRMQALSAGFQMHLAKPVEPPELIVVLASLSQRKKFI